ncbi:hypothetical protein PXC01_18330 [Maribacter sp. M208]|uniref:hypothetical protein n=1 Tax=Maribacter huludaoensis TaxID=3030010 RepID=UPI0023ECFE25|nr:hypothetical protein [Maribacter huludaoensis]MDF4223560.1 hypothetical protein [Maribacter huludaoensis]
MGLSIDLVISRENYSGNMEDLLHEMNFEILEKTGSIDLFSKNIEEDEIGIAIQDGHILIKHYEIPTYFIHGGYSRKNYSHPLDRFWNNTERMLSLTLISSINGFGYSLFSKFSNENREHRHLMGNYEGLAFEGDYGELQDEEVLLKTINENGKIPYNGKEYEIHEIGTELTEDVLFNFYGKDIFDESITFQKFKVKYYDRKVDLPVRKELENKIPTTDNSKNESDNVEKLIQAEKKLSFWQKLMNRLNN